MDVIPLFGTRVQREVSTLRFEGPEPRAPEQPAMEREEPQGRSNLLEISVQAFAEGFAQGRAEGRAAGRDEITTAARYLLEAASSLATQRAHWLKQAESDLVELALAIATRVIRTEVECGQGVARRLAEVGLARLSECPRLTVRLHPEDVVAVAEALGMTRDGLSIVADPEMSRGGAVVEGELGKLDARLETQLDEIRRAMLGQGPG